MVLEVKHLTKSYGPVEAVRDVSFTVDPGEFVSILGPSGSGKTTLLKLIAGLDVPSFGSVEKGQEDSTEFPVIIVFQDYVLFPHMTVFENIAFGLRARKKKFGKKDIDRRVSDMLEYFGLTDKAQSFPAHISGGQKQRVAIARAMTLNPYILLLDEPFANLDQNLKMDTASFIRKTQKEFGITTIAVTHDQDEAFAMSDRLGVLLQGELRQIASPRRIYKKPADLEVARFLGSVNVINDEIRDIIIAGNDPIRSSGEIFTRAEGLSLVPSEGEISSETKGKIGLITDVRFSSRGIVYTVSTGESMCRVQSTTDSFRVGDRVRLKLHTYFEIENINEQSNAP